MADNDAESSDGKPIRVGGEIKKALFGGTNASDSSDSKG